MDIAEQLLGRPRNVFDMMLPGCDWKSLRTLGDLLLEPPRCLDNKAVWHVVTTSFPSIKKSVEATLKG